jgi:serine/threonine-protein kinase
VNFCPGCGKDLRAEAADSSRSGPFVHRVIAERYRLLSLLGEGGMGAVYKAEHIRMGKALALKILRGDFAREPGAAERFLAEARIVSRLSHPNTIAVFDFGEIDAAGSGFYLAMEYVPGSDLAAVLREDGPLSEPRVADVGQQILASLGEAHDAGIVHRDVKPGNVMLVRTRAGEDFVKVLDFGIAKLRHGGPEAGGKGLPPAAATSAGAIVGTPSYVAPEQARGGRVDARSDLYAVGCLLYELAAGRPPFVAPTPMAIVAAHLREEPPPLASVAPGVSRKLAEVVHHALRKRPEDRFASADEMREALAAVSEPTGSHDLRGAAPQLTGELGIASREDFAEFEREVRALRRSRVLAPVAALLAVAALGIATWRWPALYAAAAARAPAVAALVPRALRPGALADGDEHEPNDRPADANALALPAGPAGGPAAVRGHVGAKLSATSGDVDVYRLEIPPLAGRKVVVAEWRGERPGEGIRGLDVALALNRERPPQDGRVAAPLVASADRGGAGLPERLVAAAAPGVHYLTVREQHGPDGPVEKPTDRYVLEVRLADPAPGEEIEPNDAPDDAAPGEAGYEAWRALAAWNLLAEGAFVRGETAPHDPDLYAVDGTAEGGPALVVALPDPGVALAARRWRPRGGGVPSDDAGGGASFEDAFEAAMGELLVVPLGGTPRPGAPVLVQLRGAAGQGGYTVAALGDAPASGTAVLARVRALAEAGRAAQALELAAAFAASVSAPSRDEVLRAAEAIAERAAAEAAPEGVAAYERAAQLLGASILEAEGGAVRYRGAFAGSARRTAPQDEGPAPEDRPSSGADAPR